jgi:hypothetical protein
MSIPSGSTSCAAAERRHIEFALTHLQDDPQFLTLRSIHSDPYELSGPRRFILIDQERTDQPSINRDMGRDSRWRGQFERLHKDEESHPE